MSLIDSPTGDAIGVCNVLMQTGCTTGQKCTWIEDNTASPPLGHVGCAPVGTAARGAACTYMPPGANGGYDNCMKGDICIAAECKQICDQNGGSPTCATGFACGVYSGVFGPVGGTAVAGACDPTCDPLADNKFGSAKTKTGTTCGTSGCYGAGGHYTCVREVNNALYNRSPCNTGNGCADALGNQYLNGCASGFVPFVDDTTGSSVVDCQSYCKPADCSTGACGAANINQQGASPHACNGVDSSGTFDGPSTNCIYEWRWTDTGSAGQLIPDSTEDTVGYCKDQKHYFYDTAGAVACTGLGQPVATCVVEPNCSTLPIMVATDNGLNTAGDWGCVNHTIGNNGGPVTLQGKRPNVMLDHARPLYHRVFKP